MQRLDLVHPGEGQLVVGPVSLGDDRDLVFAGAFERPIVMSGNILDYRERIVSGIDDAFEEGHAVSTLPLHVSDTWLLRTPRNTRWHDASPPIEIQVGFPRAPAGSSDVICGIRATARRVHPQAKRRSPQLLLGVNDCHENKPESDSPLASLLRPNSPPARGSDRLNSLILSRAPRSTGRTGPGIFRPVALATKTSL